MRDTREKIEADAKKLGARILALHQTEHPEQTIIRACNVEAFKATYGDGWWCALAWYASGCELTGSCC